MKFVKFWAQIPSVTKIMMKHFGGHFLRGTHCVLNIIHTNTRTHCTHQTVKITMAMTADKTTPHINIPMAIPATAPVVLYNINTTTHERYEATTEYIIYRQSYSYDKQQNLCNPTV